MSDDQILIHGQDTFGDASEDGGEMCSQPVPILLQRAVFEGKVDDPEQVVQLHRFGEVIERAETHSLHGGPDVRMSCYHHHGAARYQFFDESEQVDAGLPAEDDIAQNQIEPAMAEFGDGGVEVLYRGGGIALTAQESDESPSQYIFVVDNQNARDAGF